MRITCGIFLSLVFCSFRAGSQTRGQKIDKLMARYYANGQFNGTVLVADRDKVILKKGYGYANFEWKIRNTPGTKFRIGSVTKTFTDVLAFQLVEKRKLKLDGVISDYLPDYPKPQGEQITIYQLMTHTSGLPDYDAMDIDYSQFQPHEKILAMFDSLPLEFKPGSQFKYTNSGAFVLGVILEKVTGKAYEQLLNENIIQPLGLTGTGYDHTNYVLDKRASGYKVFGPQPLHDTYIDMSVPFAAYGMYSTCEDLYRWTKSLYENKLLSQKSTQEYFKPFRENWACDWVIMKNPYGKATDNTVMVIRGGNISGFVAFAARIENDKNSIVLLDNTASSKMEEIIQNIVSILYNKPYEQPKQSLQKAFIKLINQKGMAAAVHDIKRMRLDTTNYYLSGMEFLKTAYTYRFDLNDPASAITVLELVRNFYPGNFNRYGDNSSMKDVFNVYGVLGDTYLQDGQKEKAIECFKKALELNPKDTRAIKALNKLDTR